ncbi:MAG: prepilin-type N-terminal cleavage/methylation domain-containing protein [Lachnospiraceae bacterium]|nr:prepilin-type N-terminal cleavage/methylation domain-containing protein [Lachnospiraceae bacterium]
MSNKGFTLVELVVVLVILAILAALVTPALLGFIDNANREEEKTHAKVLLNAVQSKLSSLYDQGLMPNVDPEGIGDKSTDFLWKTEWSNDVIYNSGLKEKPYICGFACGQLSSGGSSNYLDQGLGALKKGYKVYAFFYMDSNTSAPLFYYGEEWSDQPPQIDEADGSIQVSEEESVFLSSWYVLDGCQGTEGVSRTWDVVLAAVRN